MLSTKSGFTLVELLVVIAIIGVLIALLLPAVQAAREAARRMQCTNNLKQLGIGMHNHHDTKGLFPPGFRSISETNTSGNWKTSHALGWCVFLLPFMEQNSLYEETLGFIKSNNAAFTLDEPVQTGLIK